MAADLAIPEGPQALHAKLEQEGLVIDVLVNNAGFGMQGPFDQIPLERQLAMIQLNVTSLTALTRLLLPGMMARNRGGVLNVGSTAGFQPGPLMAVYYATKAYVLSFTEAIAEEVSGSGLKITCLAPGPTVTGFATEAAMTGSRLFKAGAMSADDVARIGFEGWKDGKTLVIAGTRNRIGAFSLRLAPRAMVRKVVKRLNTID
jgi:short-subunit dehydrogenase